MLKSKKREIVCPRADCFFYSCQHAQVDGEWIPITFCAHPNNELIDTGKSCNFYRMDWAKQLQKVRRTNPADRVKLERQSLLKLLQSGIGNLSPDERDAALGLVEQLKQQEERLGKLSDVLQDIGKNNGDDPFVIPEQESIKEEPVAQDTVSPVEEIEKTEEPPPVTTVVVIEETPEDVIRQFLESWNKQQFDLEYACLGKRLRGTPEIDYIRSRQYAYADAMKQGKNGSLPEQELGQIYSSKIDGNTARVICDKIEKYGRYPKTYQGKFALEKENGKWKITGVQTREK